MAILRVKSGPQKGKTYEIRDDSLVVGRDAGVDIQVLDHGVSRKHAEIFRIGEMYFVRDLESRNGTFVNDKQVSEELLRIGDQLRIGNTTVVFEDRLAQLRDSSRIIRQEAGPLPHPSRTIQLKATQLLPSFPPEGVDESIESKNLNVLVHLSHIIAEEKNLSRLFSRVSELVGKSLHCDHLYILGSPPAEAVDGEFEILGRYDREETPEETAGVSRGIIRDCLQRGRSVLTSDASLDQQFNAMASVVMNQLRSVICVPLAVLGKNLGVVYVYSKRADAFTAEQLELASAVGIQIAATIELLKLLRRSDKFFRDSMRTLVSAIEMRSPEKLGRSERVATYCLAIAKELGFTTQGLRNAWLAGMLHDIGSIPMSDKERENRISAETKRNYYARHLLTDNPAFEDVLPAVECQNERFDGSGSPEGKRGNDIPQLARVLGLALELERQLYRGGPDGGELSVKEALLKVKETADKQFDRQTVNALLIAYRNGKLFNQDEEFFEFPG
jgi:putative methionine-R-sulfoxide reductase with GAF domain